MSQSESQSGTQPANPLENEQAEARNLAAAYAFGATDAPETERVRAAMAQDAQIGDEVQTYRRLFAAMHYTTPPVPPPAELADRIREGTSPALAAIVQSYTGPGSEAAQTPYSDDPRSATAPAAVSAPFPAASSSYALPPETEQIGYWPNTPAPVVPRSAPAQNPFLASSARVNPLTGRPYAPATPAPAKRGAPAPAPKPIPAIPSDFVATPILFAGDGKMRRDSQRSGSGAWIGWGAALVAVGLLVASNLLWYNASGQTAAQQQQVLTQIAQLQIDLTASQQNAVSLQERLNDAETSLASSAAVNEAAIAAAVDEALAESRATIEELRSALTDTQESLVAAQEQLASLGGIGAAQVGLSEGVLSALAQGSLEEAMLQPINAAGTMTATARIVWNPDMQQGMLVAMNMPELEEERTYQLWLLRGGVPTSAGLFQVDGNGMGMLELSDMPIGEYEVAAITSEPMAGSESPTGTILIAGEL